MGTDAGPGDHLRRGRRHPAIGTGAIDRAAGWTGVIAGWASYVIDIGMIRRKYVELPMWSWLAWGKIVVGSVIDATEGEGLTLRRNVEGEFILTNALLTHADTTLTDGHRHALTPVAEHQGAVAPLTSAPHRQPTPAELAPRRIVALPADPGTAAESGLAATLSHLLERLRLGSADEWLRWMRTYALLWLAGVVFYLLLAAGAFIADGILTWSP